MKQRFWAVSTAILVVLILGGCFIFEDVVTSRTNFIETMVSKQIEQGIEQVENSSPRQHYLAGSQSLDYYAPDVNDRKQWKVLYDFVLEQLNQSHSTPPIKVYDVTLFTDGVELHGLATVNFFVLPGWKKTIHFDVSTSLPRYTGPTGESQVVSKPREWTIRVF
jgi:hypothetical protein